jgi:hypothetical protein
MSKKVSHKASITNQPTCGGPIKAGLAPRSTNFMMGVKANHHFRGQPFKDDEKDYACNNSDSGDGSNFGSGTKPSCFAQDQAWRRDKDFEPLAVTYIGDLLVEKGLKIEFGKWGADNADGGTVQMDKAGATKTFGPTANPVYDTNDVTSTDSNGNVKFNYITLVNGPPIDPVYKDYELPKNSVRGIKVTNTGGTSIQFVIAETAHWVIGDTVSRGLDSKQLNVVISTNGEYDQDIFGPVYELKEGELSIFVYVSGLTTTRANAYVRQNIRCDTGDPKDYNIKDFFLVKKISEPA